MKTLLALFCAVSTCLSACATTRKLPLPEFTMALEEIQSLSDEQKRHEEALDGFLAMRGRLAVDSLQVQYEAGLEVSILWLATRAGKRDLVEKQITALLEAPNRRFIAMEVKDATSRPGFVFTFWARGWTHPLVRQGYLMPDEIKRARNPAERVAIWRAAAIALHPYEYGRLHSSWGMSYGDRPVESIYFDTEIETTAKVTALEELIPELRGSPLGNAYYCLSVLSEQLGEAEVSLEYARSGAEVYASLDDSIHHYHEMEKLCERQSRKLKAKGVGD